jgi:hypothetical protein
MIKQAFVAFGNAAGTKWNEHRVRSGLGTLTGMDNLWHYSKERGGLAMADERLFIVNYGLAL